MIIYRRLVRPVLFRSAGGDAEAVHERTLSMIELVGRSPQLRRLLRFAVGGRSQGAPVRVAGIDFPGRVGLAAGMDKDGRAVLAWSALGFGHAELGTVTARPQPGNDRPRLFRLPASGAVINRMGFNNRGAQALASRLTRDGVRRGNGAAGMPVGISIGKTKITPLEQATEDYLTSYRLLAPHADYLAINVSSPNTPGLRALQEAGALRDLLTAIRSAGRFRPVPIFVKVAPDLTEDALEELLGVCTECGVSGLIATNTTLDRSGLRYGDLQLAGQAGGLSGAPLTRRARAVVAFLAERTSLPVIGVGGIMTADDGQAMFDAGAALVQLYTGFIYAGPGLIAAINRATGDHALTSSRSQSRLQKGESA
ncbi:quinone-dependent dihydroorotate dehydrogenase [Microlunatus speluncae]|uniref:quinone-dependent dihydroorotate dehydrogenase n=1 Tax=Microlunatus speluncae TaxID=2594267 RepID=UPI00126688A6|nr:quinone-dependent dihydroorotate dehydrogenase [Microlunatus speluncae]